MTPLARLAPRRSPFISIALVAAVYVLTLAIVETRAFWITDNDNKFLQLQAIVDADYSDSALQWPGRALDPKFEFNPLPPPFSHVEDGKLYSQYSPVFSTVSSLPYRWFSFPGLYLIPLCGSILTIAGVARLARTLGLGIGARHAAVWIVGLGTPVWFYAAVFWEHSIAVGLCVWAVDGCVRFSSDGSYRALVLGSALAAGAACFREELVLFCAALLAIVVWNARGDRVRAAAISVGTMAVGFSPLLLLQWKMTGAPLGFHVSSNLASLAEHASTRLIVAFNLFAAAGHSVAISLLITAPFLVALLWNPRLSKRAFHRVLPVLSLVASAAALASMIGFFTDRGPIVHLLDSNSLFPAAPIVLLALVRRKDGSGQTSLATRIWLIVLFFAGAYLVAAPRISSGGIHWGNRFLLVTYPLLGVLAARNLSSWLGGPLARSRWRIAAIASTLIVSLAAQVWSIRLLDAKKDFSYRAGREVARYPDAVVVSNLWWVPQMLFTDFYDREIYLVRSPAGRRILERRLLAYGHEQYLYVTAAGSIAPGPAGPGIAIVDDGPLDFFSLAFELKSLH